MAKKKKRTVSKFRKKVAGNSHKQKTQAAQYGHLHLPKNVNVFKEEPGSRIRLDILPYTVTDKNHPDRDDELDIALPGELWYKRPYKLHRSVGVENISVVCPTSFGKPCPICEYRARKLKEGEDKDLVAALKPSLRNLYVVIPKGSKAHEEKPYIWDISQYLFQNQLNEEIEENEDYAVFPDLEEGLTLRVRFSEETFQKNKFASTSRIDFEERDEPYDEKILEEVPNLDEVLDVQSYSKIEALFFGAEVGEYNEDTDEDDEDEEEEEEEVKITKKRKSKSLREEPEFNDPDEDEEDEDEENIDDNDEKSSSNVNNTVEDTDEDDEEEEEPPKETPKRTRTKKSMKKKDKCPYGHKFGVDCEKYDECDECEIWEECIEEKEANE